LDVTETITDNIWEKALKDCKAKTKDSIEFKKFNDFLVEYFHLKKKPEEAHYLKEALRLPYFLKLGVPDPTYITRDNFAVLGRLFKFTKKADESFIQRIVDVFKADWFYGGVDRNEAQKQLEAVQKSKSEGTYFIIRFANSQQLCFTYKKDANNWDNSNIEASQALKGYVNYINQYTAPQQKVFKHEPVKTLQKTFSPYQSPKKK